MAIPLDQTEFSSALLRWFDQHGRTQLPWQQQRTPYRVWLSEIMLQQTQVSTVIPYYQRFMQAFPDVATLAAAPLDEVLHLWTGLGYYARARNLHKTAQVVVTQYQGEFPREHAQLHALPGIGRSTASAILALTWNEPHPILDGNVKRVLTRVFGIHGYPGQKAVEAQLWQLAEACTPAQRVADYTQAIMDLGATLCTRTKPRCQTCPMVSVCQAYRDSLQSVLPTPAPKRQRPRQFAMAVVIKDQCGKILLERRPPTGIWGGLWTCPQFASVEASHLWLQQNGISVSATNWQRLELIRHAFSHFDLDLQPYLLQVTTAVAKVAEVDHLRWYDPHQPDLIGLPKPLLSILESLGELR